MDSRVLHVDAREEGASVGAPVNGAGDGEGLIDVEVAERGGVGEVDEDGSGGDGDAGPGVQGAGLEDAFEGGVDDGLDIVVEQGGDVGTALVAVDSEELDVKSLMSRA